MPWLILAILGGGSGLWLAWRRADATPVERGSWLVLPALLVALLFVYAETALLNTRWTWSACRLAPVIGLLHGYPLYSSADSSAINGWLYGPVAALAWLPAGLARSPQPALLIAAVINLVFLLLPLGVLARRTIPESGALAGLLFAAAAAALLQLYPTWYMASALNVDAIAAGLGLASCLMLLAENPTRPRLAGAAALAALATWTKQVDAPLIVAQTGWLWWVRGRRPAVEFIVAWAAAMVAVAALVFGLQDRASVVLNLWTVPSHHPLVGGWVAARGELMDLARYAFPLWAPTLVILAVGLRRKSPAVPAGALLFAAALVLLPTGVMAAIKLGGDRNSLHSVYFLAAAATAAIGGGWTLRPPFGRDLRAGVLIVLAVALVGLAVRQVRNYPAMSMLPPRCLSEEAFAFAREHPGRAYFPWDPLATLLAEGKMYHFEYGIFDRQQAGLSLPPDRLARDVPAAIEFIAYPRADYPMIMVQALPAFTAAAQTADWRFYHRARATTP